jgi:glycosyltransferase involved in cell wall biosynthesis
MRISILLPIYNEERYLAECLDSILAQTYPDWELLAIDDQSTDATPQILAAYQQRDARIRPLRNPEKGVIPALRLALAESNGVLLTRMDADDIMAPQKLQRMYDLLNAHGPGHLSTGLVEYFADTQLGEGYARYGKWINEVNLKGQQWVELYRDCPIPAPCWLVYREDLLRAGAFEPNIKPEDYDLIFRFRRIGLKPLTVPEVLLYWRDHADRTTRVYADYDIQQYFRMKLPWFLELDYMPQGQLVLWGAGARGKAFAQMLIEAKVPFCWVCDNERKWGKDIYGVKLEDCQKIGEFGSCQVIISVAAPEEQEKIQRDLEALNMKPGRDYFWFC